MPSPNHKPTGSAGFSLIEALVALVMTGLALTAIAGVFGTGLLGHRASEGVATALTVAEAKLAGAGVDEPLRPGRTEGIAAGRFEWQLTIARYDDRVDDNPAGFERPTTLQLYRIAAAVAWRDGRQQRRVELATLRLGPLPP